MIKTKLTVLIVEDDQDAITLLRRAFVKIGIDPQSIFETHDGEEALHYLLSKEPFEDRSKYPYPDVVITDLKMPRRNGFELLTWLKENPIYKVIPTIVFTSSNDERDIRQAYYLGANSYMVKPHSQTDLQNLMKLTLDYWKACELPS